MIFPLLNKFLPSEYNYQNFDFVLHLKDMLGYRKNSEMSGINARKVGYSWDSMLTLISILQIFNWRPVCAP